MSMGIKKNGTFSSMGNKSNGSSFMGIKQSPSRNVKANEAKNKQMSVVSPYNQFSNSNEVQYHPLGLKKTAKTTINTLERRSKK
jgi:hypothetical protein